MSKKCLIIKTQKNTRHEQSVSLSTKEIFKKEFSMSWLALLEKASRRRDLT